MKRRFFVSVSSQPEMFLFFVLLSCVVHAAVGAAPTNCTGALQTYDENLLSAAGTGGWIPDVCFGNDLTGVTLISDFSFYLVALNAGVVPTIIDARIYEVSSLTLVANTTFSVLHDQALVLLKTTATFSSPPTLDATKTYRLAFCYIASSNVSYGWQIANATTTADRFSFCVGSSCDTTWYSPFATRFTMSVTLVCPAPSSSICPAATLHATTLDLATARQYVRNFLFQGLTRASPRYAESLSQPDMLAACRYEVDGVPFAAGFAGRKASAEDPATIHTRLSVASVPCPVVASYVELNFTGSAVDAVLYWREQSVDVLAKTTHFGVGMWNQDGDDAASWLVSLVRVSNNLGACPPYSLPNFY